MASLIAQPVPRQIDFEIPDFPWLFALPMKQANESFPVNRNDCFDLSEILKDASFPKTSEKCVAAGEVPVCDRWLRFTSTLKLRLT